MHRRLALQAALAVVISTGMLLSGGIVPAGHVSAAASLQLNPRAVPAGGHTNVNGSGFSPNGLATISATVDVAGKSRTVQANTTVTPNGTFGAVLTFPGGTQQGTYTVTARDFAGHSATAEIAVLPVANIRVGSKARATNAVPTHRVWVNATGFDPNENVSFQATFPLYNGNSTTVQRTRRANLHGNLFGLILTVPGDASTGTVTLTATGQTSKRTGSATLHVIYLPAISVSPGTARPGTAVTVKGRDFVPGSTERVTAGVTYANGVTTTLGHTVAANGSGAFTTTVDLPPNVRAGTYTMRAQDVNRSLHATARFAVSVKPTLSLSPATIYPGQTVTVSGNNFGTGTTVHIAASIPTDNGTQRVTAQTVAGRGGAYLAYLRVPANARAGSVVVSARTVNGSARATLHIRQQPTPMPTAVPPTATPQPTATATPRPHQSHHTPALGFRSVSIWYHWMRPGTREHIIAQSTIGTKQGIWVHVWYPNGQHQAWYQQTDNSGRWDKWFIVPYNSATRTNNKALITFRLWHGKNNVKDFAHFGIVR